MVAAACFTEDEAELEFSSVTNRSIVRFYAFFQPSMFCDWTHLHPCLLLNQSRCLAACSEKAVDLKSSNVIPFLFLCPESELKAPLPEMASAIPQERRYPSVFGGPLRFAPSARHRGGFCQLLAAIVTFSLFPLLAKQPDCRFRWKREREREWKEASPSTPLLSPPPLGVGGRRIGGGGGGEKRRL